VPDADVLPQPNEPTNRVAAPASNQQVKPGDIVLGTDRLTDEQWARLEAELTRGPLAHGFNDQHWTLARVKTLIGRLFHLTYTEPGVWYLLQRHGWSCQVPARRAIERDEEAITTWRSQVWPRVEAPRDMRGMISKAVRAAATEVARPTRTTTERPIIRLTTTSIPHSRRRASRPWP
jgi:hypothetical protein